MFFRLHVAFRAGTLERGILSHARRYLGRTTPGRRGVGTPASVGVVKRVGGGLS